MLKAIAESDCEKFTKQKKAVLFLTLSYCPHCIAYKKEVLPVLKKFKDVSFGYFDMDEDSKVMESLTTIPDYFPTAVLFRNGKEVLRLESNSGDPTTPEELEDAIKKNLC